MTDMTQPDPLTLVQALIGATVTQEAASLAALAALIQVAIHPTTSPRSDAELEADLDNMPV